MSTKNNHGYYKLLTNTQHEVGNFDINNVKGRTKRVDGAFTSN